MALITKKFGDYLKRLRDKKNPMQNPKPLRITGSEKPQRFPQNQGQFRPKNEGKSGIDSKYDSVQCRECSGYGHYANECANRLRKNRGMNSSLSDEESDEDQQSYEHKDHTSLTALLEKIDGCK